MAERRKQIEQNGYQPKYSDSELLEMAHDPELTNERFHVRLVFNSQENTIKSSLGYKRDSNRAPYWATTFDMAEAADTDPELLACLFGIKNYSSEQDFSLVLIDTHNMPIQAERQSFVPTFDNMIKFCNNEMTPDELQPLGDVSAVLNESFSSEYEAFMDDFAKTGESEHDIDAIRDHLDEINANKYKKSQVLLRHKVQAEFGANSLYSGNGLTKVNKTSRYSSDVNQELGVVETFIFERDPLKINELGSCVAVIPARPLKDG